MSTCRRFAQVVNAPAAMANIPERPCAATAALVVEGPAQAEHSQTAVMKTSHTLSTAQWFMGLKLG